MMFSLWTLVILISTMCEIINGDQLEDQCTSLPGFHIEKNKLVSACLWWSDMSMKFLDAKRYCEGRGATLASFKTLEKFQLLQRRKQRYWIGLDDLETEGIYKWHNNGHIITPQYMRLIFKKGEPNNRNHNENCIEYAPVFKLLNDNDCWLVQKFVCERKFEL